MFETIRKIPNVLGLLAALFLIGAVILGATLSIAAFAEDKPAANDNKSEVITRADGFVLEFEITCYLDTCGEPQLGQEYRNAIKSAVSKCSLTEEAKANFEKRTTYTSTQCNEFIDEYIKKYGQYPSMLNSRISCSDFLNRDAVRILRENLAKFKEGRASPFEVIGKNCKTGGPSNYGLPYPPKHDDK